MEGRYSLKEMRKAVAALKSIAQDLYDASEYFPAINRNSKRLLASVEMLGINLEDS